MSNLTPVEPTAEQRYEQALYILHQLILLGQRHIPTGPQNVYDIEKWIEEYVAQLRREIRHRTAGMDIYRQSQVETRQDVGNRLLPDVAEIARLRATVDAYQKRFGGLDQILEPNPLKNCQSGGQQIAAPFPKVSL